MVGLGGEAARPTCKKCGFPGHLTFQCRNYLSANPLSSASHLLDVSSTSSEEDELQNETPLTKVSVATNYVDQKMISFVSYLSFLYFIYCFIKVIWNSIWKVG